jgi:5-oxoprolinase (ATP-hydrolysing) subunit C
VIGIKAAPGLASRVDGGPPPGTPSKDPTSGRWARDDLALARANRALGHAARAEAWELLLGPGTITAAAPCTIAIAGADLKPLRALSPTAALVGDDSVLLCALGQGDTLRLPPPRTGLVRIIASAALPLDAGLVAAAGARLAPLRALDEGRPPGLAVVRGAEVALFPPSTFERLMSASWTVTPDSDATGVRLAGPPLPVASRSIWTCGMWTGAVQVPPAGQPVILGPHSRSTGGYPRLAQVVRVDRHRLGQLRPGAVVRFVEVPMAQARAWLGVWEAACCA